MPAVTGALQGLGGATAQKAAIEGVKGGTQAAASAAPAASLRPVARPDNLAAAAGNAAASGPGFMDQLQQASKLAKMASPGGQQQQQQQGMPMPAPQTTGGGGTQQAMGGGGSFGNLLGQQPQATPTAADYIGGTSLDAGPAPRNFAGGTGMQMPMGPRQQQPDYMTAGLGTMRGFM